MLIGRWADDNRIVWDVSEPIKGDGDRTSRGLYEPTIAQMPDDNIICVMRGSNGGERDKEYKRPSHKWLSVSRDGGRTWSKAEPWTYSDGEPFFSPASMSRLIRHSNDRTYWIGNLSEENCRANNPRWPLVIGEVDPKTYGLIRDSVLVIDTKQPTRRESTCRTCTCSRDRETGDIFITTFRGSQDYKVRRPVIYTIGVGCSGGRR